MYLILSFIGRSDKRLEQLLAARPWRQWLMLYISVGCRRFSIHIWVLYWVNVRHAHQSLLRCKFPVIPTYPSMVGTWLVNSQGYGEDKRGGVKSRERGEW